MMALCGMAAGFVVSSPTSIVVVPQTVSSASMFFGKSSAQPKKAPAKAKGVVVPARSSAFKKGAKRPTASLNIVERGPAGLLEPLKEGKKVIHPFGFEPACLGAAFA